MFCNICLSQNQQYVEISCGHDICEQCALKSMIEHKAYRCSVCLELHPSQSIPNNARKSIRYEDSQLNRRLFCLDCYESFEFSSLKNGRHRSHNFLSLKECLPSLKEMALSQLNKTLILQNTLLLSSQKENDSLYLQQIQNLSLQIHRHFQQERQLLLAKENELNKQIEELQANVSLQLQRRRQTYLRLNEQVHEINETLEGFINDNASLDQLEALQIFREPIDRDILTKVKEIEKQPISIPKFIYLATLQQYLNTNIFLKHNKQTLELPLQHQQPPLTSGRRVNLRSKVNKKLHCF